MIDLLWLSWFEDWCCFDGCVVGFVWVVAVLLFVRGLF